MSQRLYHTEDVSLSAGPTTATIAHGLIASGSAVTPDVCFIEWLADPGASARWWTSSKSSTQVVISFDGNSAVSARVHVWYWHSIEAAH